MTDEVTRLDGNAAAGRLSELFKTDMSRATVRCEGCGREGAIATLMLYGGPMGIVLRCPGCDTAILRLVDNGRSLNLDLRGAARLSVTVVGSR